MALAGGPQARTNGGDGKTRTAVGYIRVSSQKQEEQGFSLESQEAMVRDYADEHGYSLDGVWIDVISTKDPNPDRAGFYQVLNQIESDQADAVLIRGTKRLGRNMPDKITLGSKAETHNVEIVGVGGDVSYDMSSPQDEFIYNIKSAMDRLENRQRAQLVKAARREKAQRGYWPQGRPPTGYETVDDGKGMVLVPDDKAWYIRQVYEYYVDVGSGSRLREWALELPGDVPRGKSVYSKILSNKVYAGFIPWQGDWFEGRHVPIVGKDLWNRAWRERKRGPGRPTSDEPIR